MNVSARFKLISLFLVFWLAGCAVPEETGPPQSPQVSAPVDSTRPARDLANFPRITMQPPERAMRDGLNGPDAPGPERLVGLSATAIQKMLGLPNFKRRDPPAEIWQYRKSGCLLDVFLYLGEDTYRVSHVEARGHSIEKVSGTECLLEALAH
ncbi:MAG: hypothetical protein H8E36_03670 [Rhodospirillaceae bacterium]|nr:hypothetical protein [Rhodospirillaceae bacterium]